MKWGFNLHTLSAFGGSSKYYIPQGKKNYDIDATTLCKIKLPLFNLCVNSVQMQCIYNI